MPRVLYRDASSCCIGLSKIIMMRLKQQSQPGTGFVIMINDHLYEGRFTPRVNGKRISKNVYAKTREGCEEKLAELIKSMKAEIEEMKKSFNA